MELTSLDLEIGGCVARRSASVRVCDAVILRYGPFVVERAAAPAMVLEIRESDRFEPALEHGTDAAVEAVGPTAVRLTGGARGGFDLATRRGFADDARGLGAVDSLLRVALSLVLPTLDERPGFLVHGALVPAGDEGLVFSGESGAGKSTVARALGAACDELVVLRPDGILSAHATPYWQGRPLERTCRRVVCLRRGGASRIGVWLTPNRPALRWPRPSARTGFSSWPPCSTTPNSTSFSINLP